MLDWVRPAAIPDQPDTWDQFLDQFRAEYADMQKGDRARQTIENIKMEKSHIDQYISDFLRLANDASYNMDAAGTCLFFIKGLPRYVGAEVIKANPQNWAALCQAAVDTMAAWNRIQIVFEPYANPQGARPQNANRFGGCQQSWRQNTTTTQVNHNPQFNSSNAPCSHNNVPVPMDLSRARGFQRGAAQGNVVRTQDRDRSQMKCFNCDKPGHFAREC